MEKPMYRDQIRHNLQRIMETTKSHWGEPLEAATHPREQGCARPRVDLKAKLLGAHQTQRVESQDGSITLWQRAT